MTARVLWRFVGTLVGALVQLVTFVVLARALGVSQYGGFAAVFGAGAFAATLTGAGFTHRALRLRAEETDPAQTRATMVTFRVVLAVLLAGLALVLGPLVGLSPVSCAVAAAFIAVDAATDVCQAALAGAGRLGAATALLISQRTLVLGAASLFAVTEDARVMLLTAVTVVGANTAMTVRRTPRLAGLPVLIRTSRPYWRANLAASLSQLEVLLIAMTGGSTPSGLYGAGSRAGSPVNLLAQALLQAATPALSAAPPDQRLPLFLRMRRVTWFIVTGAAVLAVPAGFAGAWLLGEGYRESWPIIAGFVVGGALMGVNQAHQALLFAEDRAGSAARAIAIGAVAALGYAAAAAALLPIWLLALTPVVAQLVMQIGLARAVREVAAADPDPAQH